jgi:hypothetical protein
MATKLTEKQKLFKYFDVTENIITCKYETYVELDLNEYKIEDETLLEDNSDIDSDDIDYSFTVPGFFEAYLPEFNESVQFSLPFEIQLIKTEDTVIKNNVLTINYKEHDKIVVAETKNTSSDLKIITKLLDNQVKYLRGNVSKTIELLWSQIASSKKIKLHHIELIYTVLYGQDTKNGFVPIRLGDQNYSKDTAFGPKESSQNFGSTNAFNFGYINEAMLKNITRHPTLKPTKSDLEKIIAAEYHNLPINTNSEQ